MTRSRFRASTAAALALLLSLSGCSSLLSLDGDPELCRRKPSDESLAGELVILRVVENPGPYERLVLDRVQYLEPGRERYLNRVVFATTEKLRGPGVGLPGLQRGDTLRVTTSYMMLTRGGGYEAYISNWAAREGECWDGAYVSQHTLESVERAVR